MLENKNKIFNIVLFAALTALCYIGTFIMIPLPTGGKVHLGNLICILSALLLGGIKGGLIGSLGMGLNDLHFYLDTPSTIIRTLVLKFLMGLICGVLFKQLNNKKPNNKKCSTFLIVIGVIFLILAIYSLYIYLIDGMKINNTLITFNLLVPICLFIFTIIFILVGIILLTKNSNFSYLLIAVSLATIFNICGEFIFRVVLSTFIDRMGFEASLTLSFSKIPASILTGSLTFLGSLIIYPPLSKALDIENNYI